MQLILDPIATDWQPDDAISLTALAHLLLDRDGPTAAERRHRAAVAYFIAPFDPGRSVATWRSEEYAKGTILLEGTVPL